MAEHRPTPLSVPVPTVLAVGVSTEVLRRAAAVLAPTGVALQETNLIDLRTDSAKWRPLILLVDAELYDFDPEAFDMVAQDVGSKLAIAASAQEAAVMIGQLLAKLAKGDGPASSKGEPPSSGPDDRTDRWDFSNLVAAVDAQGR